MMAADYLILILDDPDATLADPHHIEWLEVCDQYNLQGVEERVADIITEDHHDPECFRVFREVTLDVVVKVDVTLREAKAERQDGET